MAGCRRTATPPRSLREPKHKPKYSKKHRMKKSDSSPSHIGFTTSSDDESESTNSEAELHSLSIQVRF